MFEIGQFETFSKSVEAYVRNKASLESSQCLCLTKYLTELKVKSYVVEKNYTDAGYLVDYANYYSRCHADYFRHTHRIHYFDLAKDKLEALLEGGINDGQFSSELNEMYQGFVVLKPLPQTIIGRTCLRPYPKLDTASGRTRVYPILRTYSVSLHGLDLSLQSIAFQEQDKETAACATAAIWYALHGMPKKITTQEIASPFEITNAGSTTYIKRALGDVARRFPTGGLGLEQIEAYLRSYGLECIVCGVKPSGIRDKLKAYLASYVHAGYPMIIVGEMYSSAVKENSYKCMGLHAITALGYAISPKFKSGSLSNRIERLFAHDDNIGPFTSFQFRDCPTGTFEKLLKTPSVPEKDATAIQNEIQSPSSNVLRKKEHEITEYLENESGMKPEGIVYRKFVPAYLVIPLNQKIRLPYEVVATFAEQIQIIWDKKIPWRANDHEEICWSIEMKEVSELKAELSRSQEITKDEDFRSLLSLAMPKYVWRLAFSANINGQEVRLADYLFDATDLIQGGGVVGRVEYRKNQYSKTFVTRVSAFVHEWMNRYSAEPDPSVWPILHTLYGSILEAEAA